MTERIGVLVGWEQSFPRAFLERANKVPSSIWIPMLTNPPSGPAVVLDIPLDWPEQFFRTRAVP